MACLVATLAPASADVRTDRGIPATGHGRAAPPPPAATEPGGESAGPPASRSAPPPLEEPIRFLPSLGFQCRRFRNARVCDGPRRVPEPYGEARRLAEELGLGTRAAATALLGAPPPDSWVDAVAGVPPARLRWPVAGGKLSRGFGPSLYRGGRRRLHKGIDVLAETGDEVIAAADGLVAYSDTGLRGYGNVLLVVHADATVSVFAHCKETRRFPGQQVRAGEVIALVGSTGNAIGPHLHFELRREGRPVDPMPCFGRDAPRQR